MFIIRTEDIRQRCLDFIRTLSLNPIQFVDVCDYKKNRTKAQNRILHKWIGLIADHTGYDMETVKDKIVLSIWPPVEKQVIVHKDGKRVEYTLMARRSTTELTTKEFSELVDATAIIAEQLGIALPAMEWE